MAFGSLAKLCALSDECQSTLVTYNVGGQKSVACHMELGEFGMMLKM